MDYAKRCHHDRDGIKWSFYRDLCKTRVIVMDNRGGRVLEEDRRSIFNDEERDWVWDKAKGDFDHLLIGASDPFLLTETFHWLEAWNEKVVEGEAWGKTAAKLGEKMRREVDFDHWSAFGFSFDKMTEFLRNAGVGRMGRAAGNGGRPARATSTTPTSPRSRSASPTASRAPSTRRSARRFATRSTRTSAASSGSPPPSRHRRS